MATFLSAWLEVFNHIFSTGSSKDRLCDVFWSRGSRWLWNLLQPYGWTHQLCHFSIQQLCWHKCSPHGTLSWESTARHEDLAAVHSQIQTVRGKHDARPPSKGAIPHTLEFPVPQKMIEGTASPGWNLGGHLPFVFRKRLQNGHPQIDDSVARRNIVLSQSRTDWSFPIKAKCTFLSSERTEIWFNLL